MLAVMGWRRSAFAAIGLRKSVIPSKHARACTRARRAQMETGTDTSTDAKDIRFYTCGRACTHSGSSAHRSAHLLSHMDLRIHRRCCLRGRRIRLMQLTTALVASVGAKELVFTLAEHGPVVNVG
jgi:hypothetical protein